MESHISLGMLHQKYMESGKVHALLWEGEGTTTLLQGEILIDKWIFKLGIFPLP